MSKAETKSTLAEVEKTKAFRLFDDLDDEIIKAELEGRISKTWAYSFKTSSGEEVEGLSKAGVDQACLHLMRQNYIIDEQEVIFQVDPTNPDYVLFTAKVALFTIVNGERVLISSAIGTKRQPIKMKLRNGMEIEDPFWYEKGSMKAIRNAKMRLIPEELKTEILVKAKESGKIKRVEDVKKTEENAENASEVEEKAPEPEKKMVSPKQLSYINALISDLHPDYEREHKLALCSMIIGRDISTSKELTSEEASKIIDYLLRKKEERKGGEG